MKVLRRLQMSIEGLHDVQTNLDVGEYVVGDDIRSALPGAREGLPEQLFVHEEDEETLALSLYVDPDILGALEQDDPHERLHTGNLDSYCVALEGVSHFVFLAYRAIAKRPVTSLEMELQAEVDKFVNAWLLLGEQGASLELAGRHLVRALFTRYSLREDVPPHVRDRYHVASRAARRYCRGLTARHARSADARAIERDVRQFYRQGLSEKLRAA